MKRQSNKVDIVSVDFDTFNHPVEMHIDYIIYKFPLSFQCPKDSESIKFDLFDLVQWYAKVSSLLWVHNPMNTIVFVQWRTFVYLKKQHYTG